jgi:hypothetical protein
LTPQQSRIAFVNPDDEGAMESKSLLTVPQFAEKYPAWSQAALRALILNADDRLNSRGERIAGNGLAPAVLRVGRRVLLDEQQFFVWIVEQQKRRKAA